jgi:predicted nucleotidyltransferase
MDCAVYGHYPPFYGFCQGKDSSLLSVSVSGTINDSSRQQEGCVVEQERTVDELLDEISRRIQETTMPEQIILFGSYARGEAGPDSDLDLLVVVQGVSHPRQESTRIRRALRGLLVPIDVIVATPEHLETYRNSPGLIYGPALAEGRILYERSTAA